MNRPMIASAMFLMISGCQVLPDNTAAVRHYDLGVASEDPIICGSRIEAVRADGEVTMWYRTDGEPFERKAYAWSVWSAPPAELVRDRMIQRMRPVSGATSIGLEIQQLELLVTDSGARARLIVAIRTGGETDSLPSYEIQTDASPAGLAGGIAQLVDQLVTDICQTEQ